jgi:protein-tyrosine phosphatase
MKRKLTDSLLTMVIQTPADLTGAAVASGRIERILVQTNAINSFQTAVNLRPVHRESSSSSKIGALLLRGGCPSSYHQNDWACLASRFGVRAVVDLRSPDEIKGRDPRETIARHGFRYAHYPLVASRQTLCRDGMADAQKYAAYYLELLEWCAPLIGEFFEWLLGVPLPLLVFCHAGKDRTGVVIYLLLKCAGESLEAICRDYECSTTFLEADLEFFRPNWLAKGITRQEFARRMIADGETIRILDKSLQKRYDGVEGYLRSVGVGDGMRSQLCKKLNTQLEVAE